ncbi:FadR/GntR family transcriptional regulator [Streptomyces sioyaensis]|uniref:FadR/GntR family transcriptional regulator n=1 Tax=Streptomyces sioyaensis TaxID=67364 RepID=UPI0037D87AC4
MALASARRSALVDDVIQALRDEITSGRWPLGTRIPPEPVLIEQLGVARGTVREGIRALAHAGLLQVRQGDGTYVRATSELSGAIQRLDSEMTDVLEVRYALDAQAARLAAGRIGQTELAALAAMLEQRAAAWQARDRDAWIDADYAFHQSVADATHNTLLRDLYTSLGPALRRSMAAHWPDEGFDGGGHPGHEELLEALRAGDAARAADSATASIDASHRWHTAQPAETSRGPR